MADEQDAASKTEEATPQKLAKAREKGDVAKTPDLAMLASFVGAAAVIAIAGGWMSRNLAAELLPFIARPESISLEGHGSIDVARHVARASAGGSEGSATSRISCGPPAWAPRRSIAAASAAGVRPARRVITMHIAGLIAGAPPAALTPPRSRAARSRVAQSRVPWTPRPAKPCTD